LVIVQGDHSGVNQQKQAMKGAVTTADNAVKAQHGQPARNDRVSVVTRDQRRESCEHHDTATSVRVAKHPHWIHHQQLLATLLFPT